jgi:hypothetical protein
MPAFRSPLSMRLNGGLRAAPFTLPLQPIEAQLGIKLKPRHDLEFGGAHYAYTPYPIPEVGLVGVLVHPNEIPGLGSTYAARPDLDVTVSIDWFGSNWLDLGRLEWQLRMAYGDLFDVAEYSVVSLPPPNDPSFSSQVHWVQFAAAAGLRGVPLGNTPNLVCSIDFELAESDKKSLEATIAGLNDSAAVLRSIDSTPTSGTRLRQTVRFDSPSMLELGRYAQLIDLAFGNAVRLLGFSACGDLLRDGTNRCVESSLTSATGSIFRKVYDRL